MGGFPSRGLGYENPSLSSCGCILQEEDELLSARMRQGGKDSTLPQVSGTKRAIET